MIDQCSEGSYITEELVQQLKLKKSKTKVVINGLGGMVSEVNAYVTIKIRDTSKNLQETLEVHALVVKRIVGRTPEFQSKMKWENYGEIKLADPKFNRPSKIQVLLGSDILSEHIFLPGVKHINGMVLQSTIFGWIVSGGGNEKNKITGFKSCLVTMAEFENQLRNFWDMPVQKEEISEEEEEFCEKLYSSQVKRLENGRYVVPTPFKPTAEPLGNSYDIALRKFFVQEKKWAKNPVHKKMSDEFMQEYIALGHMTEIPKQQQKDRSGWCYYIPYLSVIRQDAVTTKLRNVFNASSKTDNGISLNGQISAGPSLLTKIFDVILRVRQFSYFYSCDCKQMYRQILVREEYKEKMRILWRSSHEEPIQEYRLNTVTYGIDAAPWQAIRTMHQIAEDNAPDDETKKVIKQCFYVDDGLHGAGSVEECRSMVGKLKTTMSAGHLPLTKLFASHPDILADIPEEEKLTA